MTTTAYGTYSTSVQQAEQSAQNGGFLGNSSATVHGPLFHINNDNNQYPSLASIANAIASGGINNATAAYLIQQTKMYEQTQKNLAQATLRNSTTDVNYNNPF